MGAEPGGRPHSLTHPGSSGPWLEASPAERPGAPLQTHFPPQGKMSLPNAVSPWVLQNDPENRVTLIKEGPISGASGNSSVPDQPVRKDTPSQAMPSWMLTPRSLATSIPPQTHSSVTQGHSHGPEEMTRKDMVPNQPLWFSLGILIADLSKGKCPGCSTCFPFFHMADPSPAMADIVGGFLLDSLRKTSPT